jgi:hypothetical protein
VSKEPDSASPFCTVSGPFAPTGRICATSTSARPLLSISFKPIIAQRAHELRLRAATKVLKCYDRISYCTGFANFVTEIVAKTVADPALRIALAELVRACGGNKAAVARKLAVDKMLVGRVLKGERVRAVTHARLTEALAKVPKTDLIAVSGDQTATSDINISELALRVSHFLADAVERAVNQPRVGERP